MSDEKVTKKSSLPIVLIILLFIVFVLLAIVGGWFGNEAFHKLTTKNETVSENTNNSKESGKTSSSEKTNDSDEYESVKIGTLVKGLYESTKPGGLGPDEVVYKSKGMKTSEMDSVYKDRIAYQKFHGYFIGTGENSFVDAEKVKYAYESIFGEDTFTIGQDVQCVCNGKGKLIYNADNKTYRMGPTGCGGATMMFVNDKVINAEKNSNTLRITVAVAFYNTENGNIYKTYDDLINKTNEIGKIADYNSIDEYVSKNSDKLQQYTYTFELSKSGFYKYIGFERTKE